jgi:hypothetical protein
VSSVEERLARLEVYMTDLRDASHQMLHSVALLGGIQAKRCEACGRNLLDEPGPVRT